MTPSERAALRLAGMLAPDAVEIAGLTCRPVSAGTLLLAERIGLDLWGRGTAEQRQETVSRWLWSHSMPVAEVLWAVFADHWREAVEEFDFLPARTNAAADVEAYLARTMRQADACWVRTVKRRYPGARETAGPVPPADVVVPELRAEILSAAARALPGMTEERLMWELPLPRVLAYYHVSTWQREDVWTVAPSTPEDADLARGAQALEELRGAVGLLDEEPDLSGEFQVPEWFRGLAG